MKSWIFKFCSKKVSTLLIFFRKKSLRLPIFFFRKKVCAPYFFSKKVFAPLSMVPARQPNKMFSLAIFFFRKKNSYPHQFLTKLASTKYSCKTTVYLIVCHTPVSTRVSEKFYLDFKFCSKKVFVVISL